MRIYLAGFETVKGIEVKKPKYLLCTFYSGEKTCKYNLDIVGRENFLLDSGAFSFMGNGKVDSWDNYLQQYANFINKYDIKYFFNLDLDEVIGVEESYNYRKKLEKLTNKKCIPVFHKVMGFKMFEDMIKEYDYVAIGASGKHDSKWTRKHPEVLNKMVKMAKANNCKIHLLGYTNVKMFDKIRCYSVDSTSYLSGGRFGTLYKFNGKTVTVPIKKNSNQRGKGKSLNQNNVNEWIKFQEYADKYL